MTSRELVEAALRGESVPRVPAGPLAVHCCAASAGHSLRAFSTRAEALAESVLRYHDRFRPDAVWVSADTWVSAEAMGATVGADTDDQPLGGLGEPPIRTARDLERIPTPAPESQGRYPVLLDALRRVVGTLGGETCVVACFDQYPFSLAAALMGIENLMLRLHDDPSFVEALMARCEEFTIAWGLALSQAGAHILSGGDSPAGLIGPRLYESVALPAERRVIAALRTATGKPVSLHICGRTTPILARMATSGASFLEVDHLTDLASACRLVGPEVGLWGNLDPVGVFSSGTPEHVREQTRAAIRAVREAGHARFVVSSGCTLPVGTPAANLEAFLEAACV